MNTKGFVLALILSLGSMSGIAYAGPMPNPFDEIIPKYGNYTGGPGCTQNGVPLSCKDTGEDVAEEAVGIAQKLNLSFSILTCTPGQPLSFRYMLNISNILKQIFYGEYEKIGLNEFSRYHPFLVMLSAAAIQYTNSSVSIEDYLKDRDNPQYSQITDIISKTAELSVSLLAGDLNPQKICLATEPQGYVLGELWGQYTNWQNEPGAQDVKGTLDTLFNGICPGGSLNYLVSGQTNNVSLAMQNWLCG